MPVMFVFITVVLLGVRAKFLKCFELRDTRSSMYRLVRLISCRIACILDSMSLLTNSSSYVKQNKLAM